MKPSPPSDPVARGQNPAMSRVQSTRDSAPENVSSVGNSNHGQNHHSRDVKINDIVGSGISGILYKWVNYGKGWRPRWFILQDGVLSYYKIHGPDRIVVTKETEKGSRVIGEESVRRISRRHNHHHHRNGHSRSSSRCRKPVGEVHLKVSFSFSMFMRLSFIRDYFTYCILLIFLFSFLTFWNNCTVLCRRLMWFSFEDYLHVISLICFCLSVD